MSAKMQIFCGFFLVALLLNTQNNCGVQADDKNLTRLLNNQVIVTKQIMCVLEKSPCDQLGRQLKGEKHKQLFVFFFCAMWMLQTHLSIVYILIRITMLFKSIIWNRYAWRVSCDNCSPHNANDAQLETDMSFTQNFVEAIMQILISQNRIFNE